MLEAEVVERGLPGVHAQVHGTATTTVAAVGAAAGDMGLVAHGGGSVTAGTGTHGDADIVEEHRGDCRTAPAGARIRGSARLQAEGAWGGGR